MRIVYASLLLGLSACTIIGFPIGTSDSDSSTSTSGPEASSSSSTSGTGTTAVTTGATTDGTTTDSTGSLPTTGVTTGSTVDCGPLDELACTAATECRAVYGIPYEFPGCTPLPAFLGCIEDLDCGVMPTTVCHDNSLEVYVLDDTCVPPDYTVCDTDLLGCGDACLGLAEPACTSDPNCSPHYGAPHVVIDDMTCADFNNLQFLACDKLHDPCPPAVVTACPMGQPDTAFDISSGCIPPGFESCGDGPIAECP